MCSCSARQNKSRIEHAESTDDTSLPLHHLTRRKKKRGTSPRNPTLLPYPTRGGCRKPCHNRYGKTENRQKRTTLRTPALLRAAPRTECHKTQRPSNTKTKPGLRQKNAQNEAGMTLPHAGRGQAERGTPYQVVVSGTACLRLPSLAKHQHINRPERSKKMGVQVQSTQKQKPMVFGVGPLL